MRTAGGGPLFLHPILVIGFGFLALLFFKLWFKSDDKIINNMGEGKWDQVLLLTLDDKYPIIKMIIDKTL